MKLWRWWRWAVTVAYTVNKHVRAALPLRMSHFAGCQFFRFFFMHFTSLQGRIRVARTRNWGATAVCRKKLNKNKTDWLKGAIIHTTRYDLTSAALRNGSRSEKNSETYWLCGKLIHTCVYAINALFVCDNHGKSKQQRDSK